MPSEFDRYTTPRMTDVWSADWKFRRWAEIEMVAATALDAPPEALDQMRMAGVPSAQAVADEETRTRHDVLAFLKLWRAGMGPEGRKWSHQGLTSSDVVDTANGLRMKASTDVIRASLDNLTKLIGNQALANCKTVRVGRTHGQHAEVTTWGWRLAVFAFDLIRAEERLSLLSRLYQVGKLSGPVGDYKTINPKQEADALLQLGLHSMGASTQVVSRDVYVDYVHALAQIANVVESMALEVRLSSRSEVGEMREGTNAQQRGSSAMPHKRNPITAEQLCGLARMVRAQVEPVAQGVALHHERDLSHSSVERLALVTASQLTDYMLTQCFRLYADLRVYPERMRANLEGNLEVLSSLVKDLLVADYGMDPKDAYEVAFWGFRDWTRPESDRGPDSEVFETLADALSASWHQWAEHEHVIDPGKVPDFQSIIDLFDKPGDLVGQTADMFAGLDALINPADVVF